MRKLSGEISDVNIYSIEKYLISRLKEYFI